MLNIAKQSPTTLIASIAAVGIVTSLAVAGLFTTHASALTMDGSNSNGTYNVMIMTHLCNPSIKDWNDFENMESGKSPALAIATDVLACPTTGLQANSAVAGTIASPRSMYNFNVMSDMGTKSLTGNGSFMPTKICESDVGADLNHDGNVSTSTCLDISDYNIPITTGSSTIIHVEQTMAPVGYHFGVLRFTPVSLDGNNDAGDLAYLDTNEGHIDLNMVPDKDGMIMLHVYEFANATSTGTGGGTTGGGTGGTGGGMSTSTATSGLGASINSSIRATLQSRLQGLFSNFRGF